MRADLLGSASANVIADLLVVIATKLPDGLDKSEVLCPGPAPYFLALFISLGLTCVLSTVIPFSEAHLDMLGLLYLLYLGLCLYSRLVRGLSRKEVQLSIDILVTLTVLAVR